MTDTYNIKERWENFPETTKKAIQELHKLAQLQCDTIDALVSASESFESSYAYQTSTFMMAKYKVLLEELEYRMQHMWGFQENSKFHTWWRKPKTCTCPEDDNKDIMAYGHHRVTSSDCPVHGYLAQRVVDLQVKEYLSTFRRCELELKSDSDENIKITGWFSKDRINEQTVPTGMSKVAMRFSDLDPSTPATLEPNVGANHYGDLLLSNPLAFPPVDGYYSIISWKFVS
jgi:hypothetical protein